jgi:DNA-3-methyladenine glycosylase II
MQKINSHLAKDPKFKPIIISGNASKLTLSDNLYNDLVKSVVFQQLSTKAASTIYGRFLELFPEKTTDPEILLKYEIPQLRAVGLSNSKASYVKNISTFFIDNDLFDTNWSEYNDKEVIELLTQIKGVGVWTVQMILISSLAREDVFPEGDLGIQKSMSLIYKLDMESKELKKKMIKISQRWRPFRTYASLYLWRWLDT